MHVWIVVAAWVFALVVSIVVLGFAVYEVVWKARRLDSDRLALTALVAELTTVSQDLQTAAERARGLRPQARD